MKKNLIKVIVFFKQLGFIKNAVIAVFAYVVLTNFAIPDVQFNIQLKNPKVFTMEEISKTPKDKLPRYFSVSDAEPMQNNVALSDKINTIFKGAHKDSVSELLDIMGGYDYVIQQKIKKGDTTISSIVYPVYSKAQIDGAAGKDVAALDCYIVINDSKVTQKDLEDDAYFKDPLFSIAGKFDGRTIDDESKNLLEGNGYKINSEAILLDKGDTPMSMISSILLTIVASILGLFCLLALLPISVYEKMLQTEEILQH